MRKNMFRLALALVALGAAPAACIQLPTAGGGDGGAAGHLAHVLAEVADGDAPVDGDLPAELLDEHQIHLVPFTLSFGDSLFLDKVTITPAEFYRLLGFEIGNQVPREGTPHWAWLYAPKAADWKRGPNLMVVRSEKPIDATGQQVLFYLYAADLERLREQLIAAGVKVGGICYPEYLPKGEFETHDPDGYRLMIAQSTQDTP